MNISAETILRGKQEWMVFFFGWCNIHFIISLEPTAKRWAKAPSRMNGIPSLEFESIFDLTLRQKTLGAIHSSGECAWVGLEHSFRLCSVQNWPDWLCPFGVWDLLLPSSLLWYCLPPPPNHPYCFLIKSFIADSRLHSCFLHPNGFQCGFRVWLSQWDYLRWPTNNIYIFQLCNYFNVYWGQL